MQVTCLRRGTVTTFERIDSARQYHGAVILKQSDAHEERLVADARLVEATAADGQSLVADITRDGASDEVVTDATTVRERDNVVQIWDNDIEDATSECTTHKGYAIDTVTET